MKIDHIVAEVDRAGIGAFDDVATERPVKNEHRLGFLHGKGDMIEASDAACLLSGDRTDTTRCTNRCAGRRDAPDKSASGRVVCHIATPPFH
jgi:hypothetical protein